jgi:hypothetical protein
MTCRICGAEEVRFAPGGANLCTVCAQAAAALRDWYEEARNTQPENYTALLREAARLWQFPFQPGDVRGL